MEPNEIDFDESIAPVKIKVKFRGEHYILTDAPEAAVIRWRDELARGVKISEDGEKSINNVGAANVVLVSGCLFHTEKENPDKILFDVKKPGNINVPEQVLKGWPTKVIRQLYETVERISELESESVESLEKQLAATQKKLEKAKKLKESQLPKGEQPGMTDTSDSPES